MTYYTDSESCKMYFYQVQYNVQPINTGIDIWKFIRLVKVFFFNLILMDAV